jgi:hypothetical protein
MTAFRIVIVACASACSAPPAHVEVTDLCITYPGVKIGGVSSGATTIDKSFIFDKLAAIQSLADSLTDLQLTSMAARATSGTSDLSFVAAAHVTLASGAPSSTLPVLDVYDCTSDCIPPDGTLALASEVQTSVLAYVETGSLLVDVQLAGTFPNVDWTMDLDACFRGKLDVGT